MNQVPTIRGSPSQAAIEFVDYLAKLGVTDLALLRRAGSQPLGEDPEVFDLFINLYRPIRSKFPVKRWACYYVATLYPWHPHVLDAGNLAHSLRAIRPPASNKEARARFDRTVTALLGATELNTLRFTLTCCVRQIAAHHKAPPINWALLIDHLSDWFHPHQPVQYRWASDYFRP